MGILGKILGELASPVTDLISEVVVDKDKKREIELQLQEIIDRADARYHDELMGQIEINKEEAKHPSVFVAGWRPFIGWVGGVSIAYTFVVAKVLESFGVAPVELDTASLMTLVLAILGIGAQRSFDKMKDTSTDRVKMK